MPERVWRKGNPPTLLVEVLISRVTMEIAWSFLGKKKTKLKGELPYNPATPLLRIYLEKTYNSKRHMHSSVHCSVIYSSQDMEAT